MKRRLFPVILDPAVDAFVRREIRLVPEWLILSLINTFVIGLAFVMIMAVLA